ncbi:hypothetical protein [Mycobacterium conspicuum]|uniref:Uncharacterized protein n=1 Tax=Mycobacterium conspicuum TaxID=44010 RepID=A0A1X1T2Z2_9MYCO|nr:hypothetical protein [Mycobacterium conspicuum]ORV38741.1 hypothetical protein AWC00_00450 [Mycobacterium conspicuum]BBZ41143.1 hypothetical protein MCNS_42060 [Mycobacterium conspicuum]
MKFDVEGRAFIAAWDRLKLAQRKNFHDLPDECEARPLVAQANFLAVQRTNPLHDVAATLPRLLLIDFGEAYLAWVRDPHSEKSWDRMFNIRYLLADEFGEPE